MSDSRTLQALTPEAKRYLPRSLHSHASNPPTHPAGPPPCKPNSQNLTCPDTYTILRGGQCISTGSAAPLYVRKYQIEAIHGQPIHALALATAFRGAQRRSLMRVRPHAHIQRDTVARDKHEIVFAPTTDTKSNPDLPILTRVEDWAHLLHNHTHADVASLANKCTNAGSTGSPVIDSSSAVLVPLHLVQHYAYGNWEGTMQMHDCLSSIFRLLGIDPSISLLQQ
jgi:hypothetical protein